MAVRFAFLAGAIFASPPLAADPGHERAPAEHRGLPCEAGETLVFAGEVRDDFGLGIAVCVREDTLTIRYSGEGDPRAVSCRIGGCSGIIEFNLYVRYRLTIITLAWRDENGEFKLTESFDSQNESGAPVHSVTCTWVPPRKDLGDAAPLEYRVDAYTQALSLVALAYRESP